MADQYGNSIPAPGISKGTNVPDDELLYSYTGRFTQKGVTLEPGQGVLALGTVLARKTSTKKYVKYVSGGADGAGTAVGILRKTTDTGPVGSTGFLGNIVISGILQYSKMSTANSGQDVSAILGGRLNTVLGTFTL